MASSPKASELILNPDGSVYHLALKAEQVAPTVILVGDPGRVPVISGFFDEIEHRVTKREFNTHTGRLGDHRLTVISTGIGTDNIDITITELDALFNIDPETRQPRDSFTRLDFIRIGTSGCLQPEVPVGSLLASAFGLGLDGLLHFYRYAERESISRLTADFQSFLDTGGLDLPIPPYFGQANAELLEKFGSGLHRGITVSCPGFYGPQGRHLRLKPWRTDLLDQLAAYQYEQYRITNIEMETAAIYAMAESLGHRALSLNALIANRASGTFSEDPRAVIVALTRHFLSCL